MNYQQFIEYTQQHVAALIEETYHETVQPAAINVLWTGQVMEIQRAICWHKEHLFILTYDGLADTCEVNAYAKE